MGSGICVELTRHVGSSVLSSAPGDQAFLRGEPTAAVNHWPAVVPSAVAPPPAANREWPWQFKVLVLGRFQVLKDDAPIRASRRTQRKPLELLQALIAWEALTSAHTC
jgi:hypothetical protein